MGWSGSDFQRTHNFSADSSAGINILASRVDAEFDNFETGLEACLKTDGTNAPAADFAMAGYKHTNVGAATSTNQYLRVDQFQKLTPIYAVYAGTSDAIQASTNPAFTALVTGHTVFVSVTSANTTTSVTLAINGLSAYTVVKPDGNGPSIGEVKGLRQYVFNGTNFVLMTPQAGGTVVASTTFQDTVIFSGSVTFASTVNVDGALVVSGSASFTSATIYDGAAQVAIGYRDIPVITFNIGRDLSVGDASHCLYHATTSVSQLVVPTCASVAFPIGTVVMVQLGPSSGLVSVSAAGGTPNLYRVGTGSAGSRILSAASQMQLHKVAADTWFIGGVGVT